ncbi:MAG: branched-chain amino acid ABC transporter permease [Candidatus Caldarchaeum sp.]|uniref:Branched-chain amino acid ABC transporter permease n=1 Tax=Caldiarchaeum subterraneum TaxID=311458 RepID=A0A7J3VT04_CALS0
MSPVEFLNYFFLQLVYGLSLGLLYGLMAVGLSLIFGVTKMINFAHGEIYMLGGYTYFFTITLVGLSPVLAMLSSALVGILIGVMMERYVFRPAYNMQQQARDEYAIIATFGLSILLQNLALFWFGTAIRTPPPIFDAKLTFGLLELFGDRVAAIVISSTILITLYLYVAKSWTGAALRAVSQNMNAASILGISKTKMNALSLAVGGGLAALAGALLSNVLLVYPDMGVIPTLKAFVIIVLGGMGSIFGSLVGGLLLGVVEALGSTFVSVAYRDVYGFIVLILVLLLKPNGLFGELARRI